MVAFVELESFNGFGSVVVACGSGVSDQVFELGERFVVFGFLGNGVVEVEDVSGSGWGPSFETFGVVVFAFAI